MPADPDPLTQYRVIAVGLVWNRAGRLLFCKKPPNRGVFPGQWGFPGGGLEPGETMTQALRRELREEIGIEVEAVRPAFFKDGLYQKAYPDGTQRPVYMIFLVFHCLAQSEQIILNQEFSEYRWVSEAEARLLDINEITRDTLERIGPWEMLQ